MTSFGKRLAHTKFCAARARHGEALMLRFEADLAQDSQLRERSEAMLAEANREMDFIRECLRSEHLSLSSIGVG